jgi:endogenous inhibitor of DNA gyrase (YacG/DUF329 family)
MMDQCHQECHQCSHQVVWSDREELAPVALDPCRQLQGKTAASMDRTRCHVALAPNDRRL